MSRHLRRCSFVAAALSVFALFGCGRYNFQYLAIDDLQDTPFAPASDSTQVDGNAADAGVTCAAGFADCDGDPINGCETPLDTLTNCGACEATCALPGAEVSCQTQSCELVSCNAGLGDCDGDPLNGCEQPLDTLDHCSACDTACEMPQSTNASCGGGVCTAASCTEPFADCDGDGLTCETNLNTLENCQVCGVTCGDGSGRLPSADATCDTGTCEITACDPGFDDCDGLSATGCEAELANDEAHCGACDNPCAIGQVCTDGTCEDDFESYAPSNVDPSPFDPATQPDVAVDCGSLVFNTDSLSPTTWCGTQITPVVENREPTEPNLVIIPLGDLDVAAGSTLTLVGSRTAVFLVFGNSSIAGTLDASANGSSGGPGNNWECNPGTQDERINGDGAQLPGGGGGGGGALGEAGGRGGAGGPGGNRGEGGLARGTPALIPLLPGCRGGWGGGCGTPPGGGGGAVQLSVTGVLEVTGAIRSNGADGANGCGDRGGASGGGSGGAILLEGGSVNVAPGAVIEASGGRGGRGAGAFGGNGGDGSSTTTGSEGASSSDGGGGGGGSAGRVRINGASGCTVGGSIQPSPSTSCP